jgi:allantoicase
MSTAGLAGMPTAAFTGLIDLASDGLGGRVLGASDEFFAEAANLIEPGRGVFLDGKFTERGKWMDGWESRRRRTGEPDHDWCVVALGAPGEVVGFDIDTNHFLGNHPPFGSIDGVWAPGAPLNELSSGAAVWTELLPQAPLRPGAQNLFAALPRRSVSHVRLNIFPDGGVARLRVFGHVTPPSRWDVPGLAPDADAAPHVPPGAVDLAAVKNGGRALACSDAFFGPMNNLLLPGRAENMGGGWETRRRRGPGHDWILIKLAAPGVPDVIEVDTNHFKGNYPDRCSIDAIEAPEGARITDLVAVSPAASALAAAPEGRQWYPLVGEANLGPHQRHFFTVATSGGPDRAGRVARRATHVRLNVFPDGGISRLRIWGRPA